MERTDAELLQAARKDPAAFGEVYRRHAPFVFRWLERRLRHLAVDRTAETCAQSWLCGVCFHGHRDGAGLPWMLGITQNVLNESLRRDRVEAKARLKLG